jgi:Flp pilus assembly protein TadD
MRITLLAATLAAARPRPTALRAALRRRGGDVVETAAATCKLSPGRAEELASLNEREHAAECIKVEGEAWSGALEPDTDIPQTDKFAIPDWYLPDLDKELRNNGDVEIHVTKTPLFTKEECEHVIAMADDHANNAGGWGKIPAGRYDVHGGWVKDIKGVKEWFDNKLRTRLYPCLRALFPDAAGDGSTLRVQSAYLFKYTAETGAATVVHVDSGLLSFTIALNEPDQYEGGGTWFESVDRLVEMPRGHVTFRPGHVRHQGRPLTRGTRYMIGGFIMREDVVEHGRRSIERGVAALGGAVAEANFAAAAGESTGVPPEQLAIDALEHAVSVCPRVASAQLNLGTARQRIDDAAGAEVCFAAASSLSPRDPAAFFGRGQCLRELGRRREAEPLFQEASSLDALDADAAYMAALSASERGDFGSELRWLERALKADPKHAKSLVNRAVLYGEAGDLDNELACNRRAVEANPQSALAANALASCLGMRGFVDESLAVFARVVDGAGWGDAEELARAQKLHGVVSRMKAKQEGASG